MHIEGFADLNGPGLCGVPFPSSNDNSVILPGKLILTILPTECPFASWKSAKGEEIVSEPPVMMIGVGCLLLKTTGFACCVSGADALPPLALFLVSELMAIFPFG